MKSLKLKLLILTAAATLPLPLCFGDEEKITSTIVINKKTQNASFIETLAKDSGHEVKIRKRELELTFKKSVPEDVLVVARIVCKTDGWVLNGKFFPTEKVNKGYTRMIGEIVQKVAKAGDEQKIGIIFIPENKSISNERFFSRVKAVTSLVPRAIPFLELIKRDT